MLDLIGAAAHQHERQADLRKLEAIAGRLASTYPGDWYERVWKGPHAMYLGGVAFASAWTCFTTGSMLLGLLPIAAWQCIAVVLPWWVWGRYAFAPRWAHRLAKLEPEETFEINRVVARLDPSIKSALTPFLPLRSGDRFWIFLKHMRAAAGKGRKQ